MPRGSKAKKKQIMQTEMHAFKHGKLHSGKGGPVVTSRKQAIKIGLEKSRRAGKKSGRYKG